MASDQYREDRIDSEFMLDTVAFPAGFQLRVADGTDNVDRWLTLIPGVTATTIRTNANDTVT